MTKTITYDFGSCSEPTNFTKILLKDNKNKSEFIGYNPDKKDILNITVDGCLIKDGIKCDYLLIEKEKHVACFIELKGSDINHAYQQLETTIKSINNQPKYISAKFKKIFAFIVSTRFPSGSTDTQKKMKDLARNGIILKIKNKEIIFDLKEEKVIDKI